jgi:hypothetical protein
LKIEDGRLARRSVSEGGRDYNSDSDADSDSEGRWKIEDQQKFLPLPPPEGDIASVQGSGYIRTDVPRWRGLGVDSTDFLE